MAQPQDISQLAPEAGIRLTRYEHTPAQLDSELTKQMRALYAPGVPHQVPITDELLIDQLYNSASRWPHRVCTDFFGATLTYAQMARKVQCTAAWLRQMGVTAGDRVSLIAPNCPQFIYAMYGALQIGAVATLHNPLAPETELSWQIMNASPKVVIAWEKSVPKVLQAASAVGAMVASLDLTRAMPWTTRFALSLPVKTARTMREQLRFELPGRVADFDSLISACQPLLATNHTDPDLPAVMIHTGGTTGKPKSVILTNRNLVSNSNANTAWVTELRQGKETWYCILPFFHAFGLNLTLTSMLNFGGTAVLFPKFNTDLILKTQKRRPGTFILGVPPIFDRLTKAAHAKGVDISSFRYAISGAMSLSANVADAWEEITGGYVVEGYGMSETSPTVLGSPFSPNRRRGYLGLVFPSVQVRVVDPEDETVDRAEGEVGELLVKGPGCSPGYWNDQEETDRLYTADGWLRTGDLVVVEDGFIRMTDRKKELIITSGFNVYPSQVENVVRSMPGVRDVAVIGIPDSFDSARGEEVRAVLVLEEGAKIDLAQVRQWAERSLANYALPRSITVIKELPYSQLGKVMRRKVREQLIGKDRDKDRDAG